MWPIYMRRDRPQPVRNRKFVSHPSGIRWQGFHHFQAIAERVIDIHPGVAFQRLVIHDPETGGGERDGQHADVVNNESEGAPCARAGSWCMTSHVFMGLPSR